jgi:hypothetical protein
MLLKKKLRAEEDGQAMVEFAIVFPVVFLLFLVIVQTALLMTARQVVHYAAFSAARSAIVGDEDNEVRAWRAAQIACIPISPKFQPPDAEYLKGIIEDLAGDFLSSGLDLVEDLSTNPQLASGLMDIKNSIFGFDIFDNSAYLPQDFQSWLSLAAGLLLIDVLCGDELGDVLFRFPAAFCLTEVELEYSRDENDVEAKVWHYYALRVPIVNRIFFLAFKEFHLKNMPQQVRNFFSKWESNAFFSQWASNFYPLPIPASYTLTVEKDVTHGKCCG